MRQTQSSFTFALIHSPLTGPEVWGPVAERLGVLGYATIVPDLLDTPTDPRPLWRQHVASAVAAIMRDSAATAHDSAPILLVGHSGAGQLLASIGADLTPLPVGYIFMDAGLPPLVSTSRLDLLREEGGDWVEEFEGFLRSGGAFPNWTDADLGDTLPEESTRRLVVSTLRPRGLGFFSELLEPAGNLDALRGAYAQWTPPYEVHAAKATALDWPVLRRPARHFHMLVDPRVVADDLVALALRATGDSQQ